MTLFCSWAPACVGPGLKVLAPPPPPCLAAPATNLPRRPRHKPASPASCRHASIPHTAKYSLSHILGEPVKIREWLIAGVAALGWGVFSRSLDARRRRAAAGGSRFRQPPARDSAPSHPPAPNSAAGADGQEEGRGRSQLSTGPSSSSSGDKGARAEIGARAAERWRRAAEGAGGGAGPGPGRDAGGQTCSEGLGPGRPRCLGRGATGGLGRPQEASGGHREGGRKGGKGQENQGLEGAIT